MRFFWPTKLNPAPNALVRFGRVLHWIATALALLVLIGTAASVQYFLTNDYYVREAIGGAYALQFGTLFAGIALVTYFAGRALRYIFSGE